MSAPEAAPIHARTASRLGPIARMLLVAALVALGAAARAAIASAAPDSVGSAPVIAAPVITESGHATPRDYMAEARASFTPENRAYQRIRVGLALFSPFAAIAAGLGLLFTGLAQRF